MKIIKFSLLLLFTLVLPFLVQAQLADSISNRMAQVEKDLSLWGKTYKEGPRYTLEELMKMRNVPGVSIAVINDFKVEWAKAYGVADVKTKVANTTNTVFAAGSIAKPMCAMGVLKLAEANKIDLNHDINNYLTSWQYPYTKKQPITPYQILTHTAGLKWQPNWLINKYRKSPGILGMFKKYGEESTKQIADPGISFSYSNSAMAIAQMMVEDITEKRYAEYMHEEVFKPLSMNRTIYLTKENESRYPLASAHWKEGQRTKHYHPMIAEHGAGGLWTTPTDLAKYLIEIQKGYLGEKTSVISPAAIKSMLTPARQQLPPFYTFLHGINMFIDNNKGTKYFYHAGEGGGHSALFIGGFENGKGLVVMTNLVDFGLVHALVNRVALVYDWENFVFNNGEVVETIEIANTSKVNFAGKYQRKDYPDHEMTIAFEHNQLIADLWGGQFACIPISTTKFWAHTTIIYTEHDNPAFTTIEFLVNDEGQVEELILFNQNKETRWRKT